MISAFSTNIESRYSRHVCLCGVATGVAALLQACRQRLEFFMQHAEAKVPGGRLAAHHRMGPWASMEADYGKPLGWNAYGARTQMLPLMLSVLCDLKRICTSFRRHSICCIFRNIIGVNTSSWDRKGEAGGVAHVASRARQSAPGLTCVVIVDCLRQSQLASLRRVSIRSLCYGMYEDPRMIVDVEKTG